MRHFFDDGMEDVLNALAGLSRCAYYVFAVAAYKVDDFVLNLLGHGINHVAFVYNRNDFEVVVYSHVKVRDCLCLHALSGVDNKQRTLACGDRA